MRNITIALDAMGGDRAPDIVINGAALAGKRYPEATFLIFGDQSKIGPLLDEHPKLQAVSNVVHTEEFVSGDDKPSIAIRQGRKSSMQLAINAVKDGEAQCVVSAGNTGALMAMSKLTLRTLPGIDRPAICALCPTQLGQSAMLDLGANIECNANNLLQFGLLGAAYVKSLLGIEAPKVGLLNVGEEEIKGFSYIQNAAETLKNLSEIINYCGYIEGDRITEGLVDVIVTDGFTGNIALKTAEGTAGFFTNSLKEALKKSIFSKLGYFLAKKYLEGFRAHMDPRRYNGAVFLGLNGIVVKSHGGTDSFGFANAIGVAYDMAKYNFVEDLKKKLSITTKYLNS